MKLSVRIINAMILMNYCALRMFEQWENLKLVKGKHTYYNLVKNQRNGLSLVLNKSPIKI